MFYKTEKLGLVIDGHNTIKGADDADHAIDWRAMLDQFRQRGKLVRASFFATVVVDDDGNASMRKLTDWLDYNGYDVTARDARYEFNDGIRKVKGGCIKVDLCLAALRLAKVCDHIVLFAGDGAYTPIIVEMQRMGCRVTTCGARDLMSSELRRQADAHIEICEVEGIFKA